MCIAPVRITISQCVMPDHLVSCDITSYRDVKHPIASGYMMSYHATLPYPSLP